MADKGAAAGSSPGKAKQSRKALQGAGGAIINGAKLSYM